MRDHDPAALGALAFVSGRVNRNGDARRKPAVNRVTAKAFLLAARSKMVRCWPLCTIVVQSRIGVHHYGAQGVLWITLNPILINCLGLAPKWHASCIAKSFG